MHFLEILALGLGAEDYEAWFILYLVAPRPLLHNLTLVA